MTRAEEEVMPCPVCGCEERGQGGYLQCECPAPPAKSSAAENVMKPCPRCGSFATESLDAGTGYFNGYQVICFNEFSGQRSEDCENAGPVKPTSAEAIAAWNAQP